MGIGGTKAKYRLLFFSHPDFTVGFGISPNQSQWFYILSHHESRTLPPVGNFTQPRRFTLYLFYKFIIHHPHSIVNYRR